MYVGPEIIKNESEIKNYHTWVFSVHELCVFLSNRSFEQIVIAYYLDSKHNRPHAALPARRCNDWCQSHVHFTTVFEAGFVCFSDIKHWPIHLTVCLSCLSRDSQWARACTALYSICLWLLPITPMQAFCMPGRLKDCGRYVLLWLVFVTEVTLICCCFFFVVVVVFCFADGKRKFCWRNFFTLTNVLRCLQKVSKSHPSCLDILLQCKSWVWWLGSPFHCNSSAVTTSTAIGWCVC